MSTIRTRDAYKTPSLLLFLPTRLFERFFFLAYCVSSTPSCRAQDKWPSVYLRYVCHIAPKLCFVTGFGQDEYLDPLNLSGWFPDVTDRQVHHSK